MALLIHMQVSLSIAILLDIMILPLPYDFGWTVKLIRRDVRNLRTRYKTRLKHKSKRGKVAESASLHQSHEAEKMTEVPEGVQHIDQPTEHASEGSVYSKAPQDVLESGSEKCLTTLYGLLEGRLRAAYASRDRNASHEDRWRFRGSWLLLYKAIQVCPSNDNCDAHRYGAQDAYEKRMLLEMLQLSTERAQYSLHKVSKMSAVPYTRDDSDHRRYDSMLSDATTLTPTPSTAQIWLSILEATDDATKIVPMAEELLQYIWSEKKALDIIEQIGDPHEKFSNSDDAELRLKLRESLCRSS
jgi:hypothetical protein